MVKKLPIIDPGHSANATEEDGPFMTPSLEIEEMYGTSFTHSYRLWIPINTLRVPGGISMVGWICPPSMTIFGAKKRVSPSESSRDESPEPNIRRGKK